MREEVTRKFTQEGRMGTVLYPIRIKMIYMSERIVNIGELEEIIQNAKLYCGIMDSEIKKEAPSKEIIEKASFQIKRYLEKADQFEFKIEKRKCKVVNDITNFECQESPLAVCSQGSNIESI